MTLGALRDLFKAPYRLHKIGGGVAAFYAF